MLRRIKGIQIKSLVLLVSVFVIGVIVASSLAQEGTGQTSAAAQQETVAGDSSGVAGSQNPINSIEYVFWAILLVGSLSALFFAYKFFGQMKQADEGNDRMKEIAGFVREGAGAYLRQQYRVVAIFIIVVSALLYGAYLLKLQEQWVFLAFITGGFWSAFAGYIGMKTATAASSRTAAGAQKSLNDGLQVAFRSGAVMGLTVVGLGTLDMTIWYAVLRFVLQLDTQVVIVTMLCGLMGASSQALFARVGGGIFTKAADVGADLVGKVEQGIPEDDPRNPATIADNVGDNVGDVAGMGADLYESYCGSILASASLGLAAMSPAVLSALGVETDIDRMRLSALFLPMMIAAVGIVMSIICIHLVRSGEDASQKALLKVLGRGIDLSMLLVLVAAFIITILILGTSFWGVGASIAVGLAAGWVIGKWTEYSTSDEYTPTQQLADQAVTGPATVIIGGIADGMKSVWVPVIVVCVGMMLAFGFATGFRFNEIAFYTLGLYGVGIAAVGMLSTLGITLATDAYGPIADNAGGNAEMSELPDFVRERTDALDSLGNTTAATGKGFAIGSAALTALALLAAYVEQVKTGYERWADSIKDDLKVGYTKVADNFIVHRESADTGIASYLLMPVFADEFGDSWDEIHNMELVPEAVANDRFKTVLTPVRTASMPDFAVLYNATVLNPRVLIGIFLGCMAVFVFCAMTMKAVGRAAKGMVEEVRRQFTENPGIMEGTAKPDYARPVAISTAAAQGEMILPSLLGIITPVAVGMVLGVGGVLGLLVGTLTCGFCVAIYMANSGGSLGNAQKYIEAGHLGGKGSSAHKAAVVGDTVGDPFKDTSGPSLNILIKLMSVVSVVAAGLIVRYSLVALGIF
ncbi:MAG TPA: sodium-translocating pyrophosphatase [Pirellulaceae bacterium]|nr:sodium-translocating pyrophosphatase [Pirellulaceae bacterium]